MNEENKTQKRDIKELIQQEESHLNNLLEPNDLKSFKGMIDELRDKKFLLIRKIDKNANIDINYLLN